MSRNLARRDCARCLSEVKLVEEPRLITEAEARCYFPEYQGMQVAHAECPMCQAHYLAWIRYKPRPGDPFGNWVGYPASEEEPFVDLSYRSTFNDEPGETDLPMPTVLRELRDWICVDPLLGPLPRAYAMLAKFLGWPETDPFAGTPR